MDLAALAASRTLAMTPENYDALDAMVLAQFSYQPLEKLRPRLRDGESLRLICERLLRGGAEPGSRRFLEGLRGSLRYGPCRVEKYRYVPETDLQVQWAALTVRMSGDPQGKVLAFRGSTMSPVAWREDFLLGDPLLPCTGAQERSRAYLQECQGAPLFLTGHSKGGNDALSGYVMADSRTRERVVRIDCFDAPGNNAGFVRRHRAGYADLEGKLHSVFPQDSVVGQLLCGAPGSGSLRPPRSGSSSGSTFCAAGGSGRMAGTLCGCGSRPSREYSPGS